MSSFEDLLFPGHNARPIVDQEDHCRIFSFVLRHLDINDYFSCEKVSKAFRSALSNDPLWCFVALKSEYKQNLHFKPPSYFVDSGLIKYEYEECQDVTNWRNVVCCERVLKHIRNQQKNNHFSAVIRFDSERDWCPQEFQRELALDIYNKYIEAPRKIGLIDNDLNSELKICEDTLYVLLHIVSEHIIIHLENAILIESLNLEQRLKWGKSTITSEHILAIERIQNRIKEPKFTARSDRSFNISDFEHETIDRLDVIIRKMAYKAGILSLSGDAFGTLRLMYCRYMHGLLFYTCIQSVHEIGESSLSIEADPNTKVCLEPHPSNIEYAASILNGDISFGRGKVYGVVFENDNTASNESDSNQPESDSVKIDRVVSNESVSNQSEADSVENNNTNSNESDSYQYESDSSESISDDGDDDSLSDQSESHDANLQNPGEKLSDIGIKLIRANNEIQTEELESIIFSLNQILRFKRGDSMNNSSRKRSRIE